MQNERHFNILTTKHICWVGEDVEAFVHGSELFNWKCAIEVGLNNERKLFDEYNTGDE